MSSWADEVKAKYPLLDYCREAFGSHRLKKESGVYRLLDCPMRGCQSKDGCTIYDATNTFKCYNCGGSGSVIDMHMAVKGCDHKQAIRELAEKVGVEMSSSEVESRDEIQEIKSDAMEYMHKALLQDKKALEYITGRRGIGLELIKKYKIGISTGDLLGRYSKKHKPEAIEKAGFVRDKNEKEKGKPVEWVEYWPAGLLMFPHMYYGQVSHFSQKPVPPKTYKAQSRVNHRHPECQFYNQDVMLRSSDIIMVEGEFDLLQIVQRVGFESVVATNGQPSNEQIKFMNRPEFEQKKFYLLFDNDENGAGNKHRYSIIQKGDFKGWKVFKVEVSARFKDIDDQLRESRDPKGEFDFIMRQAEKLSETNHRIDESGGYLSVWKNKKEGVKERAANFVIRLNRQFITSKGTYREIFLINESGERSRPIVLSPDEMLGLQRFKSVCVGAGPFIFEGKENELALIWQYLFEKEGGPPIYEGDHIGYQRQHKIWLFGNCGVRDDGVLRLAGDDGIVWDTHKGHRPFSGRVEDSDMNEEERELYLPTLYPHENGWENLEKFLVLLLENTGTFGSWLAAGWFLACAFGEEIFARYRTFPLLMVYGKAQSGKNTLVGLLMRMWGLSELDIILLSRASLPGVSRRLAYFSNMPVVLDEYRATERESMKYNGLLRGVYDRTGAPLGEREGTTATRQVTVRGMACLLGEQRPYDTALRQRCLTVCLHQQKRRDEVFEQLREESDLLSGYLLRLLGERRQRAAKLLEAIEGVRDLLVKKGYDARHAINYAIPTAMLFNILGGADPNDKDHIMTRFFRWVQTESREEKDLKEEDTPVMNFFSDVAVMLHEYDKYREYVMFEKAGPMEQVGENENLLGWGWMYFAGIYDAWLLYVRQRGKDRISKSDLMHYIREEPYCPAGTESDKNPKNKKFQNTTRYALKLEIRRGLTPPVVAEVFGQVLEVAKG